jgi:hypothetical protein
MASVGSVNASGVQEGCLGPLSPARFIGIQCSIIQANRLGQPHLSTLLVLALAGCFLTGTAIWGVILIRHFHRVA